MAEQFGPIVAVAWLREHLGDPTVRVIDFRWYLDGRRGVDAHAAGHIPGSVFVDLNAITAESGAGRHPLPLAAQFETAMRTAGVNRDSLVVIYDDAGGSIAARLWFLLGWFGHRAQAVLDGGIQAWGEPLADARSAVDEGDFAAEAPDPSRIVGFEEVARHDPRDVLLDARAGERYRGEIEPIDARAGHIPGALSAPWQDNLGADGLFKAPDELRRRFTDLGVDDDHTAVVYCGSGVTSCHHLVAMELAGITNQRLYEGSWSDWSRRDAPAATGETP